MSHWAERSPGATWLVLLYTGNFFSGRSTLLLQYLKVIRTTDSQLMLCEVAYPSPSADQDGPANSNSPGLT